jgi:hypothetical protein
MSANAVKAGQAYVEIATKQGVFDQGLAKVQKSLKAVSGIANQIGKQTAAGLGQAQGVLNTFSGSVLNLKTAIASSVVVVGLKSAVSQFLDAGKLMREAMVKTGMSAEALNKIGFGGFISTKDVVSAYKLNAALGVMGDAMEAVQNVIGGALAPGLTALAQWVTRNVNAFRMWIDQNRNLIVIAAQVAAGLAVVGGALLALGAAAAIVSAAIGAVIGVAGFAASVFGVMAGAIGFLLSPIGLVIAGVAALGGAILYYSGAGGAMLKYLSDGFSDLLDFVLPVLDSIKKALFSGQFGAAGKVLMLSLEVAFRTGTQTLYGIWVDTTTRMLNAWSDAGTTLKNIWTGVWGVISDVVTVVSNNLLSAWDSTVTEIAKGMLYLQSLADFSLNYEDGAKQLDDDLAKRNKGRVSDLEGARAARETTIQQRTAENEATKQKRLDDAKQGKSGFSNALEKASTDLREAMLAITKDADKARRAQDRELFRLPQIKDINQLFAGTAAVGTGSGFAADKFGAGRESVGFPAVIQQLKKTNDLLERQNQAMAKAQQNTYNLPLGP